MGLWIPPAEEARLMAQRAEYAADVISQVRVGEFLETWNRELKRIDPYLEMVRARDDSVLPALKPGYFHILRHNPGAAMDVKVIEGPDGEFVEPGENVYRLLAESDMWSNRTMRERERLRREMDRARERRKQRERDERTDEAVARLKASANPGILFSDRPWTFRAGAPKRGSA